MTQEEEKRLYQRIVALNDSGDDPAELRRLCLEVLRSTPVEDGPPGERKQLGRWGAAGGRPQVLAELVRRAEASERDMQVLIEVVVDVVSDALKTDYGPIGA